MLNPQIRNQASHRQRQQSIIQIELPELRPSYDQPADEEEECHDGADVPSDLFSSLALSMYTVSVYRGRVHTTCPTSGRAMIYGSAIATMA